MFKGLNFFFAKKIIRESNDFLKTQEKDNKN
jgi:hypothetical protein